MNTRTDMSTGMSPLGNQSTSRPGGGLQLQLETKWTPFLCTSLIPQMIRFPSRY